MADSQITFEVEALEEDTQVRGNVSASGDDAADDATENEILERLDSGDVWAWCVVRVAAVFKNRKAYAYLGGCSYQDERDFCENSGDYFEDLKIEAARQLLTNMQNEVADAKDTEKLIPEFEHELSLLTKGG